MLERLAGSCSDGVTCPNIWKDPETGDLIVQGYRDEAAEELPPAPDGEARVRVPRALLAEAAAKLR